MRYVHEALQKRHGDKVTSLEKSLETNLMFAGAVWRYEERSRSAVGAISPSSVAFVVYLIDVATGRLVWKENFDKTPRPLSENILGGKDFLKKGARWLTANELAR
jgi:hypothetical protein